MATNVKKKSTAGGAGKFSYKYTDLATIHEEMEKQGITYYQYTKYDENAHADYVYTVINTGSEDAVPIRGAKIVEGNTLAGGNAAQQYGSALTYARRYSLLMALGWATEDDDGQSAGAPKIAPEQQVRPANKPLAGHLDFDILRQKLEDINTVEGVDVIKRQVFAKYPNLTDKQVRAVNSMIADRKDNIELEGKEHPYVWGKDE